MLLPFTLKGLRNQGGLRNGPSLSEEGLGQLDRARDPLGDFRRGKKSQANRPAPGLLQSRHVNAPLPACPAAHKRTLASLISRRGRESRIWG